MLAELGRWLRGWAAGVRSLRSSPAYLLVSVLLLGTSSAGTLAITSMLDALLVRPPSVELVYPHVPLVRGLLSFSNYLQARDSVHSFAELAAYDAGALVALVAGARRVDARVQSVNPGYFPTIGITAATGRLFTSGDDQDGAEPVVLLREDLRERLAVELGASVQLNSRAFRVIGTLPRSFAGLDRQARPALWIPLRQVTSYFPDEAFTREGRVWLRLAGRLAPGVTLDGAREELQQIDARIELASFTEQRFRYDSRARTLLLLGGALAALYLLALCNLFLLTLLRAYTRRRDLAMRFALGARPSDVGAWLWGELSTVIGLGLGLGYCAARIVLSRLALGSETSQFMEAAQVTLDLRSVAPSAAVCAAAAWSLWHLVQVQARTHDVHTLLKEGTAARSRQRLTRTLLAAQLALAVLLLALSLASWDSLRAGWREASRFPTERVLLLDTDARELGPPNLELNGSFYQRVIDELRRVPGVRSSAGVNRPPLAVMGFSTIALSGDPDDAPGAAYSYVSSDYFATLGSHLEQGRSISPEELRQATPSVVINRPLAQLFWPSESPLGKTFVAWPGSRFSVVGVIDHTLSQALGSEPMPEFYMPFTLEKQGRMTFLVRVEHDSPELRQALTRQLESWWPLHQPPIWRSLDDQVDQSQLDLSVAVRVLLSVAVLSGAVSALGLYFFSSFTAAFTLKEAALRLALGATWQALARRQLQLYGSTALFGLGLGSLLVWATRPVFHWLDVATEAPGAPELALALTLLLMLTVLGLAAPLWRLRQLDICRTLNLD